MYLQEVRLAQIFQFFYILNKYVHSERDINNKVIRHLDGAVKIYLQNDYQKRINFRLPNKNSHRKIKLWRIDGNIDTKVWMGMISFFYRGNEMILEYFDPEGFEKEFDLRVRDFEAWKAQQTK